MDRLHEICAWCWTAGQLTVLSAGTSTEAALMAVEDREVSHGICKPHSAEQRELVEALKNSLRGEAICA